MSQTVLFVRKSSNIKTGPIPVTYSSRTTCPTTCGLYGRCYGEDYYTSLAWNRVDAGQGVSWSTLCANIADLPDAQIWRLNVVGDLPRTGGRIDARKMRSLIRANRGRRGYTYSHNHDAHSIEVIRQANAGGFTVNLSADNLAQADALAATGAGPVAVILPSDAPKVSHTAAGRRVVVCPAQSSDRVTCATCGLCAVADRSYIIGFRAHGTRSRVADELARQGAPVVRKTINISIAR